MQMADQQPCLEDTAPCCGHFGPKFPVSALIMQQTLHTSVFWLAHAARLLRRRCGIPAPPCRQTDNALCNLSRWISLTTPPTTAAIKVKKKPEVMETNLQLGQITTALLNWQELHWFKQAKIFMRPVIHSLYQINCAAGQWSNMVYPNLLCQAHKSSVLPYQAKERQYSQQGCKVESWKSNPQPCSDTEQV